MDDLLSEIQRQLPRYTVTWEEPRSKRQGRNGGSKSASWVGAASLLRLRPGEWLKIAPVVPSAVAMFRKKMTQAGYEATIRSDDGTSALYVRWPR